MEKAESTAAQSLYEEETLPPRIERAFEDVPYPGDDRLVPDPSHWEGGRIAQEFAGQHWKTIPLDVLSSYLESLSYFTPESFRYYLPAYLLAAVRRLSAAEVSTRAVDIPEALAYHLTPPRQGAALDEYLATMTGLTPEHKTFIREQQGPALEEFRARMSGLTLAQKTVIRDLFRWLDQRGKEWEKAHLPEHAQRGDEADEWEIVLKEYWENVK